MKVLSGHLSRNLLHILLPLDVNSSNSRQIDDSQIWTVITINPQLDWVVDNVAALTCNFVSQFLNVRTDLVEVVVFLRWLVLEYAVRFAF